MDSGSARGDGERNAKGDRLTEAKAAPRASSRTIMKLFGIVALFVVGLLGYGFWIFADSIERTEAVLPSSADGIVVLTGGPDRIAEGMDLLAGGLGKRLLITGVGPGVSFEKLGKPMPRYKLLLDCCVDIEYTAQNTVGNAVAARDWAARNSYRSLIVVTSSYHLPRALVEFRRAMPEATLYSHPVNSDRSSGERWWRDGSVARLIILEYGKFLVAWCRLQLASISPLRAA